MGLVITSPGAGYVSLARARLLSGLPVKDVSDTDLPVFIQAASRILSRDITTRHFSVEASGSIDGTNRTFRLGTPYLADRNLDLVVDGNDVTVRTVTQNADGTLTRATVSVSSVDAWAGAVTLAVAPPRTVSKVEVDFESYHAPVYSDMLETATVAMVAHLADVRNRMPGKVTVAQLRGASSGMEMLDGSVYASTGTRWLAEYRLLVQRIKAGEVRGTAPTHPDAG